MAASRPESDIDLYGDAALADPYPAYKALRDQAPAVWLSRYDAYAVTRYADVRNALVDWQAFSSAEGISMNEPSNMGSRGTTLASDPPLHDQLRTVLGKPLSPPSIRALTPEIEAEAERLVERLVARRTFDTATDLAPHLPVTIVSQLVGVPEKGRERMLDWAFAALNSVGPANERCLHAIPSVLEMVHFAIHEAVPGKLKPGSWGAAVYEAADRGEIRHDQCPGLMIDYMAPSLDTTISGVGNAIWLFARHPDQWDIVRDDPSLIPQAINEVLRLESPVQGFSRLATRDHAIDGTPVEAGSRIVVLFGSANRDERRWEAPETFDVRRRAAEHLAFGYGPHACVGNLLARLEIRALLTALARRVRRIEIVSEKRRLNNVLRGFETLEVTLH